MYPSNEALYLDVKKILLSAWVAKAAREGKTLECVLDEEVRPENLDSIGRIAAFVERKRGAAGRPA